MTHMRGWNRLIWLLLALTLAAGFVSPASAEVMTLGVWLRGIRTMEDGSTVQVPLEGSFRVRQGGLEIGTIRAGEGAVTLTEGGAVVLEPMTETFSAGWDLSAARTGVDWTPGNVTVPILLPELTAESAARAAAAAEPTPVPEETAAPAAETAGGAADGAETADGAGESGTESAPKAESEAPAVTPALNMTPVPTAEPTAAPEVEVLSAGADKGTFRIKVFYDSNNNGACSIYEVGIAGIPVYLIGPDGQAVTGGETNSEGEITLPGLEPGSYQVRVSLPEKWGFSRKSKETGLNNSIMDFSSEGTEDSAPITVAAGETVERGVGLLKGVVVSGVCWLDENADGIMQSGEPRIAGARIVMEGQKNGLSFEAYSDENGAWEIHRIRAGFYDFIGYAPEGMMFTRYSKTGGKNRSVLTTEGKTRAMRTLDLNDGKDEPDQNIGFAWQASVSGIAFLDANYNGLYDEGEAPMAGVKVTAIKQVKDEEIAVAYTGEDGRYILPGLRGNTYTIRAVLPEDGSNFTVTTADPAGNHFTARENRRENFWKDFDLADGENREVNVGVVYYGSVSGTVYQDNDFSGTLSGGEKVVQGISVSLMDGNGTPLETKQTGARGTYSFTGLTPGAYSLRMTAQEGYAFTKPGEGNVILNGGAGSGYSETFQVPLGTDVTGMDAGMILPAKVMGTVFADLNDNGKQDAGEGGLEGTGVRLLSEEGESVFSADIGAEGSFLFDAVMPGRYRLEYRLPAGAVFADGAAGENAISAQDGEETLGLGDWFEVRTGNQWKAPLCGGLTLGSISGTVFADHDGSGERDADEEALAGAVLTLTPSRSDLETLTVETGADGAFRMERLRPDRYTLEIALPEGLTVSRLADVTLPVASGLNRQEADMEVKMGQVWADQELGAVAPAALSGRVWLDENNNGLMEEEEQTPEGYEILITDETEGKTITLLTGADGGFEKTGLAPGAYTVSFRMSGDMDEAPDGDSTFERDGDSLTMADIPLAEGESRADLTMGLVRYTAMAGRVWIDRGSGAENLAGARVSLTDENGNTLGTETTEEDGAWRFDGLMPGGYGIAVELPEGTVAAEPDDERLETGLISVIQETDGRRGRSGPIELKMGRDQLNLDIGSVLPGTIGDYCWLDENGNGFQDGGEYGVPHVKVELMRNGSAVAETETDQYGLYFFREVYPAVYTLRVTLPAEVGPTRHRTDIPLISSSLLEDGEGEAFTDSFQVVSDSVNFNIDLGLALREEGVYPAGYGEQEIMDWSKTYTDKSAE